MLFIDIATSQIALIGVIREIQTTKPGIFGPNGGYSRAYSLTNLSWNFGLLIGPVLSGALVETVGYYYMNFTFGMIPPDYLRLYSIPVND